MDDQLISSMVKNKCLPSICWLPKLHGSLAKNTFINEAQKCSLKPISKYITSVFKLMFKQTQSYTSKVYSFQVLSNSGESSLINTAWKVSLFGVFQVRIFSHTDWIRRDNPYLSVFGLNMERFELWTWKTPNTDTFHTVQSVTDIIKNLMVVTKLHQLYVLIF